MHGTPIENLAFYRFVRFPSDERRKELRKGLKALCASLGLKGTILIAPEGINGFIAGPIDAIRVFREALEKEPELKDLTIKVSVSEEIPFRRLLVKLKKEIIPLGEEWLSSVQPDRATGPRLEPETLRDWYRQGKSFVILDTRNEFEARIGTFRNAQTLDIATFREFPEKLEQAPAEWRDQPVVMFCTGGIRCEKATAVASQLGFKEAYQLEGGILRYFEKCGGEFFDGECFVFDRRVALDAALAPTERLRTCYDCRAILTLEEQAAGHHCRPEPGNTYWEG
jgi:UPF0176 protein